MEVSKSVAKSPAPPPGLWAAVIQKSEPCDPWLCAGVAKGFASLLPQLIVTAGPAAAAGRFQQEGAQIVPMGTALAGLCLCHGHSVG